MAHFAELNEDNKVIRVIVISNDETHDENGLENEALGIAFCKSLYGQDTKWVQTSYSGSTRNKFAGVDDFFDEELNAFISTKPFASWILDEETLSWIPPVAIPPYKEGFTKLWNEEKMEYEYKVIEEPTE